MSANATTVAPTGRKKIAQGNALGNPPPNTSSPEGAKEGGKWPVVKSGDLFSFVTSGSRGWARYYAESGPLFLRVGNLDHDSVSLDLRDIQRVAPPPGTEGIRTKVQPSDILISVTADVGMVGLVPSTFEEAYINQHVALARPLPTVHPPFLAWCLTSPPAQQQFRQLQRGATKVGLGLDDIRAVDVPLPPIPVQRRIVAEIEKQFTRLEAGVAALRRVQANLKRYRAAVLKAACEGRLVPTEAAWPKTTLGEVSTILSGYGFPERLQGRASGDIGFFKVGDISEAWKRNEKVLARANHYISKADLAELRAKLLPAGTVVFAKIGAAIALNRRAIIGEPSLVDNNVMGLLASERISPRFLYHFVCTLKLDELARATTVPSIRKGDVEGIELKLPPLAEQTRIVAEVERRLSVVEELESVVTANLQRASRLRQSILQKAFTGHL